MWIPKPLLRLTEALKSLPGVGEHTAERLAFYLLGHRNNLDELIRALSGARELGFCSVCGVITDLDPCPICSDSGRENTIAVVERPSDVFLFESFSFYRGRYHVLGGVISPLDGVGPEDIRLDALTKRCEAGDVREVIIALSPTVEGDATAFYIYDLLKEKVRVTRIARGIPTGAELSLADPITVKEAFLGRKEMG
ncbi:MAG: recombination mediator RecR [candidate division WOR-3 bacterium]